MRTLLPLLALTLTAACNTVVDEDGDGIGEEDDCNDADVQVHPGAAEVCDGVDNDCDGEIDEDAPGGFVFFADGDSDGFGSLADPVIACAAPDGYVESGDDCDDASGAAYPGAAEVCDGADNDCNGLVDDSPSDGTTYYADWDGDGYGSDTETEVACAAPEGYLETGGDCNDFDVFANPDQPEICDWLDNDCDGTVDGPDAEGAVTWYGDGDGDGYGIPDDTVMACFEPDGYADNTDDCDDTNWQVNPGMEEICDDGLDNDCSGDAPECGLPPAGTDADAAVVISGSDSSDYFGGYKGIDVLDLDGDGNADLVVGASASDTPSSSAGAIHVWYGPVTTASLADTDADSIITPPSTSGSQYLGRALESAGDVNGDGYEDFVAGAYYTYKDYSTSSGYGAGYLVYGSATALDSTETASDFPTFWGENSSDYLGSGVAGLGDLDDDGYDDFAVGSYGYDYDGQSSSGAIYVFMGSGTDYSGDYDASDADLIVYGSYYNELGGYYNADNIDFGDINGDGYSDVFAGTGYYSSSDNFDGYGGGYLFYGAATASSGTLVAEDDADAFFYGSGYADRFGESAHVEDLDGDGYDDVIVGEEYGGTGGMVWVFQGGSTDLSGWYYADSDEWASIAGTASSDYYGFSIDSGDFNNDGDADLSVGAGGADPNGVSNAGMAYVYYGALAGGEYEATDADVMIAGTSSSGYLANYDALTAGDVDGDGIDDLVVGARGVNSYAGEAYIFPGGGM